MADSILFVVTNEKGAKLETAISPDVLKPVSELLLAQNEGDDEAHIKVCHDVWKIFVSLLHGRTEDLIAELFEDDLRKAFDALKGVGIFIKVWKIKGLSGHVAEMMNEIIWDHCRDNIFGGSTPWEDEHDVVKEILEYCEVDFYDEREQAPDPKLVVSLVDTAASIKGEWDFDGVWGRSEEDTRYVYEQFLDHMKLRLDEAEAAAGNNGSGSVDFAAVSKLIRDLTERM